MKMKKNKTIKNYIYIKHFITQYPTFALDIYANSRILHYSPFSWDLLKLSEGSNNP